MDNRQHQPFRPQPPLDIDFAIVAGEFIGLQRQAGFSAATLKRRERVVRYLLEYVGGKLPCMAVSPSLVAEFAQYLKTVRGLSPASVRGYLRTISPIIKYGVSRGYIPEDFSISIIEGE